MTTPRCLLVSLFLLGGVADARADGGTVRFCGHHDAYHITIFTAPSLPRVGPVDVSVLVQDSTSGAARSDIPVLVHAHPVGRPAQQIGGPATVEAATNKLFRAAVLELPEPGPWRVEVAMGTGESVPIEFEVEAAEPLPAWIDLGLWIGWPAVVAGLFAIHQLLVHRRQRTVKTARMRS
jgi:hypothetical protein